MEAIIKGNIEGIEFGEMQICKHVTPISKAAVKKYEKAKKEV